MPAQRELGWSLQRELQGLHLGLVHVKRELGLISGCTDAVLELLDQKWRLERKIAHLRARIAEQHSNRCAANRQRHLRAI